MAQPVPEAGPLAPVGVARFPAGLALLAGGISVGDDHVAGTSTADVGECGLGADLGAGELLAEGDDGPLGGGVGVTGTTTSGVEATGADGGGLDLGRDAAGGGGGGSTEEVAGTAAAGVGVAVLSYGWVRLGDEVGGGRHFG